jgi:phage FluMu protein Com
MLKEFRCYKCRKLLAKYGSCAIFEIKCPRCGFLNVLKRTELEEIVVR